MTIVMGGGDRLPIAMVADRPAPVPAGRRPTDGTGDRTVGTTADDLTPDEAYHLLGHRRRRLVLQYFSELLGVRTDVDRIAAYVHRREAERGHGPDRRAVVVRLHHDHLPTLDASGVIAFDHRRGTVRYVGSDTLERIVRVAIEQDAFP